MKYTIEQYLSSMIDECDRCPYPVWDRCNHRDCILADALSVIEDIIPYYDKKYNELIVQERQRNESLQDHK